MDENIENTAEPIEAINIDEPAQANNIEETTTVEAVPEPANNEAEAEPANNEAEAEPANNEAEAEPANNEVAMESTETSQPTETSPEYGDYTPPVKPARTEKQSEHDEGAAKMLVEMREKYETAFEKVPEKKRPKAKAWRLALPTSNSSMKVKRKRISTSINRLKLTGPQCQVTSRSPRTLSLIKM